MASLLVSVAVSANGVIPVLELDYTRSATETLKKIGIHDACIVGAKTPVAFTYCREGSSTLWKYQALDLEQLAAMQSDAKRPSMIYQPVSVVEFDSAACDDETGMAAEEKPTATRWLFLGLLAFSLLIALRYSYRAIQQRHDDPATYSPYSPPVPQARAQSLPSFQATARTKALAAFGFAAAVAFMYFKFSGF
ncbi:hypothetical protein J1D76_22920 [Pseudomonas sp. NFX15]